jgi:hypothetical protein
MTERKCAGPPEPEVLSTYKGRAQEAPQAQLDPRAPTTTRGTFWYL